MRVSNSFGTNITEKPPRQLVPIVFWSGIKSNGPKMSIFGQNASFGSNLAVFGPKSNFLAGGSKTFGTLISGNLDIWGKKSIFCIVIAIFVNRAYHLYTRGYNFHIRCTPKKNSVSELGVIFRGSPLFLAVLGLCHDRGISTLNFGPISTKLGGTVRAI